MTLRKPIVGVAVCGSFCTHRKALEGLRALEKDYTLVPILSEPTARWDTRFGKARDFARELEALCGRPALRTLEEVEPLGPKALLDALLIAPCTGNTLGKLACGIADSPVTFGAKAHLRNGRPLVVALSTNDGLAGAGESIGRLLNRRHYYFVPFGQDSPTEKPRSLVADFSLLAPTLALALHGEQIQPILL